MNFKSMSFVFCCLFGTFVMIGCGDSRPLVTMSDGEQPEDNSATGDDDDVSDDDDTIGDDDDTVEEPVDADADGWPEGIDCDDSDHEVNPLAEEICDDGIDNNCDELTDEEDVECQDVGDDDDSVGDDDDDSAAGDDDDDTSEPEFADTDGDGYTEDVDCDDADSDINPSMLEQCGDGVDNDCDGLADYADLDGCDYPDEDGDGWDTSNEQDCDDTDPDINPDAIEDCTDGIDNDCDGAEDCADDGCVYDPNCWLDADGDGYTVDDGDCNDIDADINPDAEEICDDGIDNNCDDLTDEEDEGSCQTAPPDTTWIEVIGATGEVCFDTSQILYGQSDICVTGNGFSDEEGGSNWGYSTERLLDMDANWGCYSFSDGLYRTNLRTDILWGNIDTPCAIDEHEFCYENTEEQYWGRSLCMRLSNGVWSRPDEATCQSLY